MTTDLGWEWSEAKVLVDMIITAITIVAMAVPEGMSLIDCGSLVFPNYIYGIVTLFVYSRLCCSSFFDSDYWFFV
jgi:hypothetical protein